MKKRWPLKAKHFICAVCGIKAVSPKTLMHNNMHRYVCSGKCMGDFYKVVRS